MRFARSLKEAFPHEGYAAVECFTPAPRVPRRPLVIAALVVAGFASAFAAGRASAEEAAPVYTATAGWHSKHLGAAPGKFNEDNVGAGLQVRTSPTVAYTAGVYRNSIRNVSGYAGAAWTPLVVGSDVTVRAGVFAGIVSGYEVAPVVPFGGPLVEVNVGRFMAQAVVMPKLGSLNPYTVAAIRVGVSF